MAALSSALPLIDIFLPLIRSGSGRYLQYSPMLDSAACRALLSAGHFDCLRLNIMLLNVFTAIVLPLFLLMGIGYVMDRQFKLDVQTLSRINFYVLGPALVFKLTYSSTLSVRDITGIGVFYALHTILLFALAFAVFS